MLKNLRDLSSVPLSRGSLRPGTLFRSDDVCTIGEEQAVVLRQHGISNVIDLRGPDELLATGRGPLEAETTHHHLPLILSANQESFGHVKKQRTPFTPHEVGQWYFQVAHASIDLLVKGIGIVAHAERPVLFHCAAGKDRTGIFAATLLVTLGAPNEAIVDDYVATQANLPEVFDRLRAAPYGFSLEQFPYAGAMMDAPGETMATFLDIADQRFGGLDKMLFSNGLSDQTLKILVERYVSR
jgi:protein tyrosine/serine phosphatase